MCTSYEIYCYYIFVITWYKKVNIITKQNHDVKHVLPDTFIWKSDIVYYYDKSFLLRSDIWNDITVYLCQEFFEFIQEMV